MKLKYSLSLAGLTIVGLSLYLLFQMDFKPFIREKHPPRVIAILKTMERKTDFWIVLEEGLIQAAEDFNINLSIEGPMGEEDIERQLKIASEALASRPDVLILAACDYTRLVTVAEEAERAGIPLIMIDSFIDSDKIATEIGTASYDAGRKAGEYYREHTQAGTLTAIISFVRESSTGREREQGLIDVLKEDYPLLDTLYNGDDITKGKNEITHLMEEHREVGGIIALNESSGTSTYHYLKENHRGEIPFFVSIDSNEEIINGLEDGLVKATVVQKPYNIGYIAIRSARQLLDGRDIPVSINTNTVLIHPDNMYDPLNQKLLFPIQ